MYHNIKQLSKSEAIKALGENKEVFLLNFDNMTIGTVNRIFDQTLFVYDDFEPLPAEEPEPAAEEYDSVENIDYGKIRALREGKWTYNAIAEEMRMDVKDIRKILKMYGL